MNFSLTQLRYVVAVARQGSVTAAAKALNVSQPSISVAVDQVEKALGQKLFIRRRGSGIALTVFGGVALTKAKEVLAQAEELVALGRGGPAIGGELVLGCFEDLAPHFAPGLMRSFAELNPAVKVTVREETFETLGRRLSESAIDLALTYDLGLPANVTTVALRELGPHALLPAGHALAGSPSVSLAELAGYPMILSDGPYSFQYTLDVFRNRGLSPATSFRTRSFELQRSLVANGFGVAVCWTRPVGDRSYDGAPLLCKPISDPLPMQRIILAYDARQPLSKAASAFLEMAMEWFSAHAVIAL